MCGFFGNGFGHGQDIGMNCDCCTLIILLLLIMQCGCNDCIWLIFILILCGGCGMDNGGRHDCTRP